MCLVSLLPAANGVDHRRGLMLVFVKSPILELLGSLLIKRTYRARARAHDRPCRRLQGGAAPSSSKPMHMPGPPGPAAGRPKNFTSLSLGEACLRPEILDHDCHSDATQTSESLGADLVRAPFLEDERTDVPSRRHRLGDGARIHRTARGRFRDGRTASRTLARKPCGYHA